MVNKSGDQSQDLIVVIMEQAESRDDTFKLGLIQEMLNMLTERQLLDVCNYIESEE